MCFAGIFNKIVTYLSVSGINIYLFINPIYVPVYFLLLYKSTENCHWLESQLQLINIISYHNTIKLSKLSFHTHTHTHTHTRYYGMTELSH